MDPDPTTPVPVVAGPDGSAAADPTPGPTPGPTPDPAPGSSGDLERRLPASRALPPRRRTWGQRALLTFLVLLTTTAFLATGAAGWVAWKYRSIDRTDVALDQVVAAGEPRNYLVVGSDTRSNGDPNDPGAEDDHEPLADTIMIVRVDPGEQVASVLSLPRDLWVTISGTGNEGRINAAYAAGHQQLIDTLRAELGIPIHHYVEVDFAGFQEVVEAVDGVPVWFDRAMRDRNSGLDILHPGCTTLDGYGALAFARARHLEYWEQGGFRPDGTGDLGRISRQQVFLRRTITRAKAKGLDNPLTLKRLVDVGTANVTLDDDLDAGELLSLARRFSDFDPDELLTYTLPTTPWTTSGGAQVLDVEVAEAQPILNLFRDEPAAGATDSSTAMVDGSGSSTSADGTTTTDQADEASELIDPDEIEVDVYNIAGVDGLAVEVADRMVVLGFAVDEWGNGGDAGHPDEARTVVRYAPADELADGGSATVDAEAHARTVAAWVAGGAEVEVDPSLDPGTIALFLGADFSELTEPTAPIVAAGDDPVTETTVSTSTTTTAVPTPLPSSEVVGMVPLGDPPPDRECG